MNINITIWLIVSGAFLVAQLGLGVVKLWRTRQLDIKFHHPLGSQVHIGELLEKFSRIHGSINVRIVGHIKGPARAEDDLVLVNKHYVHKSDLYLGVYSLMQILMSQDKYMQIRKKYRWLTLVYLSQLVLIASSFIYPFLGPLSVLISVIVLFSSIYIETKWEDAMEDLFDIATDLLDLDQVEQARAEALIDRLKGEIYLYVFSPFLTIVRFLSPI